MIAFQQNHYFGKKNEQFCVGIMTRIYLDVCSLCRPFDDQDYMRIRMETDAVNLILVKAKQGFYQLVKSPVHEYELNAITDDYERIEITGLLENFGVTLKADKILIRQRTEELISIHFGIADAAHIAFAELYNAVFISCDDKLLNKCSKHIRSIQCMNPITFCEKENLK